MFRGSGKKGGEEFDFAAGYISAVIKFINIIVGRAEHREAAAALHLLDTDKEGAGRGRGACIRVAVGSILRTRVRRGSGMSGIYMFS